VRVNVPKVASTRRPQSKPKLGQHFLASEEVAVRVVDALGDVSQSTVLEIGPGRGILTSLLARRARRLIAVELDRVLAAQLRLNLAWRATWRSLKPTFSPSTSILFSDRSPV
jgi:16S rRNA A1518/A1519 N6-dimethyltransferase RsmA/KsgA/DIM1 with predicted DNA glycosylase/AP lyase activity